MLNTYLNSKLKSKPLNVELLISLVYSFTITK